MSTEGGMQPLSNLDRKDLDAIAEAARRLRERGRPLGEIKRIAGLALHEIPHVRYASARAAVIAVLDSFLRESAFPDDEIVNIADTILENLTSAQQEELFSGPAEYPAAQVIEDEEEYDELHIEIQRILKHFFAKRGTTTVLQEGPATTGIDEDFKKSLFFDLAQEIVDAIRSDQDLQDARKEEGFAEHPLHRLIDKLLKQWMGDRYNDSLSASLFESVRNYYDANRLVEEYEKGCDVDGDDRAEWEPMPVFPILAKDALAVPTLRRYEMECDDHGLDEQAAHVRRAIAEFQAWQHQFINMTKLPDHPHRPTR